MDKINFVNNSEPDLSAENLNLLQTNVEKAINNVKNKEVETIRTGTLQSDSKILINVDYEKYDKIILEIYSTTNALSEGTSCILEVLPQSYTLINRVACFTSYVASSSHELVGHIYYANSSSLRIVVNKMTGWTNRKYNLIGILRK